MGELKTSNSTTQTIDTPTKVFKGIQNERHKRARTNEEGEFGQVDFHPNVLAEEGANADPFGGPPIPIDDNYAMVWRSLPAQMMLSQDRNVLKLAVKMIPPHFWRKHNNSGAGLHPVTGHR